MPNGRWAPVERGDMFRCRCGTVVDGDRIGPKGGKAWKWTVGTDEFCKPECPAMADAELERAMDDARGEWEADQAMERYA